MEQKGFKKRSCREGSPCPMRRYRSFERTVCGLGTHKKKAASVLAEYPLAGWGDGNSRFDTQMNPLQPRETAR